MSTVLLPVTVTMRKGQFVVPVSTQPGPSYAALSSPLLSLGQHLAAPRTTAPSLFSIQIMSEMLTKVCNRVGAMEKRFTALERQQSGAPVSEQDKVPVSVHNPQPTPCDQSQRVLTS